MSKLGKGHIISDHTCIIPSEMKFTNDVTLGKRLKNIDRVVRLLQHIRYQRQVKLMSHCMYAFAWFYCLYKYSTDPIRSI